MVLFSVRSLFLQVSKTWVTDCTSLHSLHKGSFVLVFLKLLSWLSSVQYIYIYIYIDWSGIYTNAHSDISSRVAGTGAKKGLKKGNKA